MRTIRRVGGTTVFGRQASQGQVVDKRRGIDVVFGGPGEFLFALKAAAVCFAVGRVMAAARSIHARKRNATILRANGG